jgi:hypothetical protein
MCAQTDKQFCRVLSSPLSDVVLPYFRYL